MLTEVLGYFLIEMLKLNCSFNTAQLQIGIYNVPLFLDWTQIH